MFGGNALSEERNGADVVERPWLDARRHESFTRIPEDDQAISVDGHRPEKPGIDVGHGIELQAIEVVEKNVRDAREVGAAVERPSVGAEHESVRHGRPEVELRHRRRLLPFERRHVEHTNFLLPADFAKRGDEACAITRDIHVIHHRSVRPRHNLEPLTVWRRHADQRADTVQMANTPQHVVRLAERQVADTGIPQQDFAPPRLDVEAHDVSKRTVVRGKEKRACRVVVGKRRHRVNHRSLDVRKSLDPPIVHGNRSDVSDDALIIERSENLPAVGIVVGARNRSEGALRNVVVRRQRIAANAFQVLLLKLALVLFPLAPGGFQRCAENVAKL